MSDPAKPAKPADKADKAKAQQAADQAKLLKAQQAEQAKQLKAQQAEQAKQAKAQKAEQAKQRKAQQAEQARRTKAARKAGVVQRPPALLEIALTVSQLTLIFTGVCVLGVSLLAGADLTAAALRTGVAMLVVGLVLWLANWWLARGSLEALAEDLRQKAEELRKQAEEQAETHGSLDVNA